MRNAAKLILFTRNQHKSWSTRAQRRSRAWNHDKCPKKTWQWASLTPNDMCLHVWVLWTLVTKIMSCVMMTPPPHESNCLFYNQNFPHKRRKKMVTKCCPFFFKFSLYNKIWKVDLSVGGSSPATPTSFDNFISFAEPLTIEIFISWRDDSQILI